MTSHYPDLGNASDWLKKISLATRPIRSITQNWVMTRHQYEVSALVSPTSFRGEASGGVTKCGLFSQVRILVHTIILFCITTIVILTILFTKKRTSVAS